ncbi:MAG: 4-hydroxythreonine-4-phosphate dehydrogenase PdxA [Bacteroidota bacterium]|jgi:4-hydroxythreonine-4-phosphate dehydrogenase|nr:4-hydroxythreonine-4-phosphate dehydrogenase PdxA [Bacteroidota bacterium]
MNTSEIKKSTENKPVIGITMGDINGIGPEVIIKALSDPRITKNIVIIIYGSTKVLTFYRKLLKNEDINFNPIKSVSQVNTKKINIINCWEDNIEAQPGVDNKDGGYCSYMALKRATEDLKEGLIEAVVTAPINKKNIQNEEFNFVGHTEFFTQHFGDNESLMLLVSENLRVGVVTGHIPLKEVSEGITKEKLTAKIKIFAKSLKKDFGISKPRIAVLGLNPHAGEDGILGSEENEIISPVIEEFRKKGNFVFGPYPADGFFGMMQFKKFDGVLAMYHDQGLIPFKTLAFENGINFTAGLSVVRTSPDHGTAYNIAGKNIANESSMREAIYLVSDVLKNRKEELVISDQ